MDSQRSEEENGECTFFQKLRNRPITPYIQSGPSEGVAQKVSLGRRERRNRVCLGRGDFIDHHDNPDKIDQLQVVGENEDDQCVQRDPEVGESALSDAKVSDRRRERRKRDGRPQGDIMHNDDKMEKLNVIQENEDDGCIKIHSLSSNATILVPETPRPVPQVIHQVLNYENNFIRPRSSLSSNRRIAQQKIRTAECNQKDDSNSTSTDSKVASTAVFNERCPTASSGRADSIQSRHVAVCPASGSQNLRFESCSSRTGYSFRSAVFTGSSQVLNCGFTREEDEKVELLREAFQVSGGAGETYNEWRCDDPENTDGRRSELLETAKSLYQRTEKKNGVDEDLFYEYRVLLGNIVDLLDEFGVLPVPPGFSLKCRVTRVKKGMNGSLYPQYFLHLERPNAPHILLMTAQKNACMPTNYIICTDPSKVSRESQHCIGFIESNLRASRYNLYTVSLDSERNLLEDSSASSSKRNGEQILSVYYEPNILGFIGPRVIKVAIPKMESDSERIHAKGKLTRMSPDQVLNFKNKEPYWDEGKKFFVINFKGRVSESSVKNFQIIHPTLDEQIQLQFGRTDKNEFVLDFSYPFSPLQAFAIGLSSFDAKWGLE